MSNFNKLVTIILNEMSANVSGGTLSAFGSNAGSEIGSTAGQFPSQNSKAFNDGNNLPASPSSLVMGKSKKRKGKKTSKILMQRRPGVYLP